MWQDFCVREPNTEISQGQGEAPRGPVRGAGGARKEEDHEWPRGVSRSLVSLDGLSNVGGCSNMAAQQAGPALGLEPSGPPRD
jgi:hypothetical protein